ncbi:acyl-coenzyme A thioesterase 11-like [Dendronephthya gigantea]|uniref:acyl-coenzyme A thioesterase 11-like n=1 Tax=Dendronephthya gigantea TaxID=151771 RepID=UPI00106B442C|nr:acyl-coenzyme A thioesterase 11-like [Dendronephthya gigantea]
MSAEYRNPSEVELNKIISSENVQQRNQALLAGDLLKAMDITACLAAEKHAKLPCVTLMMDDLVVNENLLQGQVLNVKAKLTRAFGSSMEVVVEASLEDMFKHDRIEICKAYFVFVAIAKVGKARLTHLDPVTMEERLEYALAYERRKLRFTADKAAREKSANKANTPDSSVVTSAPSQTTNSQVAMSETAVESFELVLPSQANHHQTTFGGQIMAWLVSTCTIAASRLCQTRPTIIEVNGVHFIKKSSVGERLVFKAMVNKTFDDNSFEVGCRVESITLEGKTAHVNSAYLTFAVFDQHQKRQQVPVVVATTAVQVTRQSNAETRRSGKIQKEKILGTIGPALSVPWTKELGDVLAFHNVSAFKKLCHVDTWKQISQDNGCVLLTCKQDDLTCVKVEAYISKPAVDVFQAIQLSTRALWDPIIAQSEVVLKVDDDDSIVHIVMTTGDDTPAEKTPSKPSDLLLLESTRPSAVEKEGHLVAYRSVTMKSYPVSENYERRENLTSGFMISQSQSIDPNQSTVIYINQVTNQVAEFLFKDLKGGSKMYAKRIQKLREFLKC